MADEAAIGGNQKDMRRAKMKRIFVVSICILLVLQLTGCTGQEQKVEKSAEKMDTVMTLTAYGENAGKAIDAAYDRIDEIEQMASSSISTSDVSKINKAAGKSYVKVHPEVLKMIKTAVQYSELSDGAFDITVRPLIQLWGIGTKNERVPSASEIKKVLPLVGYKNISIDEKNSSIKLMKKGMSIDLGGIAKGFATDETEKIFKKYGVKSAVISLGESSIYTLGSKPGGSVWSVAVINPRDTESSSYLGILHLPEIALATSGDYQRYFIKNGKRYHHILNPFTGYPAESGIMSDTITVDSNVADCNMLADLCTKIVFVYGVEKGFAIIDKIPGVACMAVTTDYKVYQSSKWDVELVDLNSKFTLEK